MKATYKIELTVNVEIEEDIKDYREVENAVLFELNAINQCKDGLVKEIINVECDSIYMV